MNTNLILDTSFSLETSSSLLLEGMTRSLWEASITSKEHRLFFYRMIDETIDSLLEGTYIHFDAQTTSNCCHGLSILVRELILKAQTLPLLTLKEKITPSTTSLTLDQESHHLEQINALPDALIDLASLYVLTLIIEIDPIRGRRTVPLKLRQKGTLGTNFCEKIVKKLQRTFSNGVAESYRSFCSGLDEKKWIANSSLKDWKKYVEHPYLRMDKKGTKYASCLFSMQISLCYLTHVQATVALVSDLMDPFTHAIKERYVRFLKNNGNGELSLIEAQDIQESQNEPVVVFGGYTFSETFDLHQLSLKMKPWAYQFASLIFACDTHYPQFPTVADDPQFDSSSISPTEASLKAMIDIHSRIDGVSANDPSLFCLSHIFVSNSKTLLSSIETSQDPSFPPCYIPCIDTSQYLSKIHHGITLS